MQEERTFIQYSNRYCAFVIVTQQFLKKLRYMQDENAMLELE